MSDPTNDHGLTAAEQHEVDEAAKPPVVVDTAAADAEAAAAKAAKDAEDEAASRAAAEAKPDAAAALAAAAEKLGTVAEKLAERAAPAPVQEQVTPPRDFDAEKNALRERREKGEIDEAEYEKLNEDLTEAKLEAKFTRRLEETSRAQLEQRAQENWERDVRDFGAKAENRSLFENPAQRLVFDAMLKEAGKALTGADATHQKWLEYAKEKTFEAFNIKPSGTDPKAAIAAAQAARDKKAGDRPGQTLDNAPSAGAEVDTDTPDWMRALDALPISDHEDAMARLPPDKLAQYLESAPGGLKDHPRKADV